MNLQEIQQLISEKLKVETQYIEGVQPILVLKVDDLRKVAYFLHSYEATYFDMLSCITAIDNGTVANTIDVLYHLYSIPFNISATLKVSIQRNFEESIIPSVSDIWKTAEWHEREAYDLVGVRFKNHPDLRRILLPHNWEGHPLQKDYRLQEKYHGVKVKY